MTTAREKALEQYRAYAQKMDDLNDRLLEAALWSPDLANQLRDLQQLALSARWSMDTLYQFLELIPDEALGAAAHLQEIETLQAEVTRLEQALRTESKWLREARKERDEYERKYEDLVRSIRSVEFPR